MTRILSPVTSFDAAVDVISAGADEIYCGVSVPGIQYMGLSTRYKWCSLSDYNELGRVVRYARNHGVKTIVTTEFPFMTEMIEGEVKNHVRSCIEEGVDALIVTDLGVLLMVKKMGIDVPLYASTYIASMNYEAVDFLKNLGIVRVILERHVTISEVQEIVEHSKDVDVEVFIHGPGCSNINVSCYGCPSVLYVTDSSRLQRTQFIPCLTMYDVYEMEGNKRTPITQEPILDAYTYCSLCKLPDLLRTGASGLKIVGRCLTRAYQVETTRIYREFLDIISRGEMELYWEKLSHLQTDTPLDAPSKIRFSCEQKRCYYSPLFHAPYKVTLDRSHEA